MITITAAMIAGAGATSIAPPKGGRQAILGRLPPTAGKSQEEVAEVVGVGRKTIDDWERNTSIGETAITCTPLDLRIKVGKAEHYAKLFLLTSERPDQRIARRCTYLPPRAVTYVVHPFAPPCYCIMPQLVLCLMRRNLSASRRPLRTPVLVPRP
ncbi:hypothetical protein ES703_106762 [subsurface metagenome]